MEHLKCLEYEWYAFTKLEGKIWKILKMQWVKNKMIILEIKISVGLKYEP